MTRVVVVGGGFGGLSAVDALRRLDVDVVLVDRRNFHLFQPLLYQVATGALSAGEIASPFRSVFGRDRRVEVLLAEAVGLEAGERRLRLADGSTVSYDYLVLAPGSMTSYFGHEDWAALAPGLKSVEDAREIRRRILLAFERAEREADPDARARLLSFVVVGGGPTGVELAGAIGEIAHQAFPGRFRSIDTATSRVLLVEMGDTILPTFPAGLRSAARRDLERLGVDVLTGTAVTEIGPDGACLKDADGERWVGSSTVIWAAGVHGTELAAAVGRAVGQELDRGGRLAVEPDLSLPGHPEILVIGDAALSRSAAGKPWPGLAPVAMQQGRHAAKVIAARLAGRAAPRFRYDDRGTVATIGTGRAVAVVRGVRLSGPLAWLAWAAIHIAYLVEVRNRVLVMTQWAWSLLTRGRSALLITDDGSDRRAEGRD